MLEEENKRNRLEEILRKQEQYGELKELVDPLTKAKNAKSGKNLFIAHKTLEVLKTLNHS